MALLYRFVKMSNRSDTHVFTFVVTKSVTRDLERDVTSKELVCGYHRWAITFSRTDKVLGVYLVWRNPSEGMRVYVDFSFTLLNREHFSINEGFSGKQVKFSYDSPAQGNRNYIAVNDLYERHFTDANGEFQLELTMGNVNTAYITEFRVPQSIFSSFHHVHHVHHRHHHHTQGNSHSSGASSPVQGKQNGSKFESTYFTFGGFDWNISIYPNGSKDLGDISEGRVSVYLNRLTGFDHQCRIRYQVLLGSGKTLIDSGQLDDVSDTDGKGYGWHPRARFNDLVYKGIVNVELRMIIANTISEVSVTTGVPQQVPIDSPMLGGNSSDGTVTTTVLMPTPVVGQLYDRDKQAWTIKSDCHSETVRLHMVYKDIHNVPRNHLRFVSWQAYLLRYHGKSNHVEPVALPGGPFSHYYAQENTDEGIIMETHLAVKEIKSPGCPYLSDKAQLRVQVEWGESYLLFQAVYHKYDDIFRMHNHQMKREICALQAENYGLERQLFSYQKSLAYAHSRGSTYSNNLVSATEETHHRNRRRRHTRPASSAGGVGPVGVDDDEDEDVIPDEEEDAADEDVDVYYGERSYSLGDRSLSTDTEYA